MKLLFPHFTAPVVFALLSVVAGCSSDDPPASGTAGTSAGGASGGKGGSTSNGGAPSAGTGAGGAAAGAPAGGSVSSGGSAGSTTAGSGGSGTAGGASVEVTFASLKTMFVTRCSGGGCHTEHGNPLQLPQDDTLYTKVTTHMTANCGALVNKANPAQSALVTILKGDCGTPPKTTPRMPFQTCADGDTDVGPDAPCIPPDQIAGIQAWIAKGAPQQ